MLRRVLFLFILINVFTLQAFYSPNAEARPRAASLVVDANSGNVLHQDRAGEARYPASLAKMMTLYLTFEALETGKLTLNQKLTVSSRAASQQKINLNMRRSDTITVKDAILAIIVKSANDAAVVLGEAVAGSEWNFAQRMTERARQLGMKNTTFKNATGFFHPQQKTTALDMAKLAIALKRDYPKYFPLFSRTAFSYKGRRYTTHNHVVEKYPGATGMKTGYINASGFNLVTTATRGGVDLVGVVMGGPTAKRRDATMVSLLNSGFKRLGQGSQVKTAVTKNIKPVLKPTPDEQMANRLNTSRAIEIENTGQPTTLVGADSEIIAPLPIQDKKTSSTIWAIEVGKYQREQEVIDAVAHAMQLAGNSLKNSQISFSNFGGGSEGGHFARLSNLTEDQAKLVCQQLRSAKENCSVIKLYN